MTLLARTTRFAVIAFLCVLTHLAWGQIQDGPVAGSGEIIAANRTPPWVLRRLQQSKRSPLSRARISALTEVHDNVFFAFNIDGAEDVTIVLKPYASVTRYRNAFGYYLKDETGRPYRGQIIWADVLEQTSATTLRINRTMLGKAKELGFFVIPDGARLNPHLRDGAAVGVAKYLNEWTVVLDGMSLRGASLPAFFSELQFNADGVGHVIDSKAPGNFNWEDGYRGGDSSFDDVNIQVSAIVDFPPRPESEVPLIVHPDGLTVVPPEPAPETGAPATTLAPDSDPVNDESDNDTEDAATESIVMDTSDGADQSAVVPKQPFWGAVSGFGEVELLAFPRGPRFARQSDEWLQQSIAGSIQYAQDVGARGEVLLELFARHDQIDKQRSYVDIQRAHLAHFGDTVSVRAGVLNETWGVLELENIADIVNQRNTAEDFKGDAKLGQPGVKLSFPVSSLGQADVYFLPYPRRRPFAGDDGRFQGSAIPVDDDDAIYESAAQKDIERWAKQGAGRLQLLFGDVEVAVSHFYGTSRDPKFDVALEGGRPVALTPTYEPINQSGIELRAIALGNVLKAEAFRRTAKDPLDEPEAFYGVAAGVERDFVRVFGSDVDLTLFGEYYYDDRDIATSAIAPAPLDNDIFIGGRLGFNDLADTQLLLTGTTDVDSAATLLALELKRRVGDRLQLTLKGDAFINSNEDQFQRALQDDHRISLRARYFY